MKKFTSLYDEYFDRKPADYRAFAEILSSLAGREDRGLAPWQYTFIYNILKETKGFNIGDEMWNALLAFEKEKSLALRSFTILSQFVLPTGSVAISKPRQCAWEECFTYFLPDHPNRHFCALECRREARNKRRREARISVSEHRTSCIAVL